MKPLFVSLISFCLLGACVTSPPDTTVVSANKLFETTAKLGAIRLPRAGDRTAQIEEAKRIVAGELKDPDAAKFRNVLIAKTANGRAVCGEVNGKNSYGAYTGFKYFMTGGLGASTTIMPKTSRVGVLMIEWCTNHRTKY